MRRIHYRLLLCLIVGLIGTSCSEEESVLEENDGPYLQIFLGWRHFQRGEFAAAVSAFDQAVGMDSQIAEAHLGLGWSSFRLAENSTDLNAALEAFDTALAFDPELLDARAGRAAAALSVGEVSRLNEAILDVEAILFADADYAFEYDLSFDTTGLRILMAQASIALSDFASARESISTLLPLEISASDSDSWTVDGALQGSYEAAITARVASTTRLWRDGDLR